MEKTEENMEMNFKGETSEGLPLVEELLDEGVCSRGRSPRICIVFRLGHHTIPGYCFFDYVALLRITRARREATREKGIKFIIHLGM
ncbi:MAG: hypothetical protein V3T58_06950 [Candidatus Hydrothermarchaeales archaeon]